ncbi:hypothetical protein ACLMJK_004101 [Lecanora helva]
MAPKIFATGTTGYVGGDVLFLLLQAHPHWASSIKCLVRNQKRGESLERAYPELTLVYGTLDDAAVLEREAENAEIVLHFASSDHTGAAEAIARGLKRREEGGKSAHWIHTSGTDVLLLQSGEEHSGNKVFDDWDGVEECTGRPDSSPHRLIDKIVLSTASSAITTAIVCPSLIYGKGRGPGNQRSIQAYELCRLILERGKGFTFGHEDYMWFHIHIQDLARLYTSLVLAAIANDNDQELWKGKGYYLAENGEHRWNDVAVSITKEAHQRGFIKSDTTEVMGSEKHGELMQAMGPAIWNVKSRAKALRAGKVAGWKPRERGLMDEVPEIVSGEAQRAGLVSSK